jgi:very-short-patch-repair endonuclease
LTSPPTPLPHERGVCSLPVSGGQGWGFELESTHVSQKHHPGQKITKEKLNRARELRRDMTSAEKILWQELRGNKLGVHFRRQQVIAGFIVDFYCHKAGSVIELDGEIHGGNIQKESDAMRDKALSELELQIVRFRNEEVLIDLSKVIRQIQELLFTQ